MKEEIEAAARYLTKLVSRLNQPPTISGEQLQTFEKHLVRLSEERFRDHWFPEKPQRGQAFRCIRLNAASRPDPLILQAATETGLKYSDLKLPVEFTMWIDPKEVSCRFGEQGSLCTVASFGESNDSKAQIETASPPPRVKNDNKKISAPPQQPRPRRTARRPLHAMQQQKNIQYRQSCSYSNYGTWHRGCWYPMATPRPDFTKPPPPVPMTMGCYTSQLCYAQPQQWGVAYVPRPCYLNNWSMGQMVMV